MRAALLLALAAAAGLAGCTSGAPLSGSGDAQAVPEPDVREYRDDLAPRYDRSYDAPIDERAVELVATFSLASKTASLLDAPAKLTVSILGPDGQPLQSADVDGAHPTARLDLKEIQRNGLHKVRVAGDGAGASYTLSIETRYG